LTKTIVVALGGNAIQNAGQADTMEEPFKSVRNASDQILEMIKDGYKVVLTHGNGPQAGNLLLQQEECVKLAPPQRLDVVVAMTQGQIGYMLQRTLNVAFEKAGLDVNVLTLITQVLVEKDDPDFKDPSKPVGPFYTKRDAEMLSSTKGYKIRKIKPKGRKVYRRVVPSPDPKDIVEKEIIKSLVDQGVVVIASGGGGIAVTTCTNGDLDGIEAVIDKDLAGEKLAEAVSADIFLILTDVECVKLNYGQTNEQNIYGLTMKEAKKYLQEGHFLAGSMGPKVKACIRFLEFGGEKAIIASLDKAKEALEGKSGTLFTRV
jgi:carbamate kinase